MEVFEHHGGRNRYDHVFLLIAPSSDDREQLVDNMPPQSPAIACGSCGAASTASTSTRGARPARSPACRAARQCHPAPSRRRARALRALRAGGREGDMPLQACGHNEWQGGPEAHRPAPAHEREGEARFLA